jgi:hypothetical protein
MEVQCTSLLIKAFFSRASLQASAPASEKSALHLKTFARRLPRWFAPHNIHVFYKGSKFSEELPKIYYKKLLPFFSFWNFSYQENLLLNRAKQSRQFIVVKHTIDYQAREEKDFFVFFSRRASGKKHLR